MRDYGRIVSKVTSTPWMMMPSSLKMILEILDAHLNGNITQEEIKQRLQAETPRHQSVPDPRPYASVGVLPLHGPIFPKANLMTDLSGATSLDQWSSDFMEMVNDEKITSIILDVDSPGGLSDMIPETAEMIRNARDVKPIYAVANTMAASAAYGLAAQATKLFASPSAITGSIGTYMVHTDESGMDEKLGVKETIIKAGRFKAVEIESLTPESKAYLEGFVGDVNTRFVQAIAEGRGMDPDELWAQYGNGRVFQADRALEVGAIDGIATLAEVVGSTLDGGGVLSQSFLKNSYDADKEHSEPGTGLGGEPTPREPPEEDDPAIKGGWRRDPPPIAYEETEEVVNREWLQQQADALGIVYNEDTSDERLADAVAGEIEEIVVPLNDAVQVASRQRDFAKDYPEESERLARAEQRNREAEAREFADGFASFEDPTRGYSPLVREQIEQSHQKITMRQFTHNDLRELLELASDKHAVVPAGETGSSRTRENTSVAPSRDFREARKQFADAVQKVMVDDNLDQQAAMSHVAQQNPELAEAYLYGHVGR